MSKKQQEQQRKERISVNLEIFDQVKRLYTTKTTCKQELLEITSLKLQTERFKLQFHTALV